MARTPLEDIIRQEIQTTGPLSVARYMDLCLYHPQHGYYTNLQDLGRRGDFTTAPELTPLFGQTLAIWVAKQWESLEKPNPFTLAELGPGQGTLMKDLLGALQKIAPQCYAATDIHLLDISPTLRGQQAMLLQGHQVTWPDDLEDVPFHHPTILIANEFLDAFPIQQWENEKERKITLEKDHLAFTTKDVTLETSPAQTEFLQNLKTYLTHGTALFIDYGYTEGTGDTLQALHAHQKVAVFHQPGKTDLTAHVNFAAVMEALGEEHCTLEDQAVFLLRHGIALRGTQALETAQTSDEKTNIETTLHRLLSPNEMGRLFKVLQYTPNPR